MQHAYVQPGGDAPALQLRELHVPESSTDTAIVLLRCELFHLKRGVSSGVLPLELVFKAAQGSGGHMRHIGRLERRLETLSAGTPAEAAALAEQDDPGFLALVVVLCHEQVQPHPMKSSPCSPEPADGSA